MRVEKLTTRYGRIQAIHDVSLHVNTGEIVTLIGSNGAGKSTTLMTISGALKPTQGTVTFEGEQLQGRPSFHVARRGIVQVPEGRRIFPQLTVAENLDLGGFARSKQVGSYFGLVPCQDQSGDKNRLGHITRDGSATVRQLLTEAAWISLRRSPTVRAYLAIPAKSRPLEPVSATTSPETAETMGASSWPSTQWPSAKFISLSGFMEDLIIRD